MADPPPPSEPPRGTSWGNAPPPPEPPRVGSAGSGASRRSGRTGYPPASPPLQRPSSTGSLREAAGSPPLAAGAAAIVRSGSSGSLHRPGSGGLGARNPSREQLEPLQGSPPLVPAIPGLGASPRDRPSSQPRLAPLPGSGSGRSTGSGGAPLPSLRAAGGAGLPSGDAAAGVPPLDLAGAGGASPSAGSQAAGSTDRIRAAVPPPPVPSADAVGAALLARPRPPSQSSDAPNAPTARGPVKWVPHTHANPKHAKFCFICLHGKMDGHGDEVEREVQRQKQEEEDLPSPVDMKELAYLSGDTQNFRRCSADFERNNITASWLRRVQDKVYHEVIKPMVAEQNASISLGVDVRLTNHAEDEKDREVLRKMFTMSEEEEAAVQEKLDWLGEWCTEQEKRLINVNPKPVERPPLPEVPDPTPEQLQLLEYQPLLDLTSLTGPTAADARDAMRAADEAIANSRDPVKGFEGFRETDLPPPRTYPDIPEAEVLPYPLTIDDIPPFEAMQLPKPEPFPIDACIDPFERPFLFLPEFQETVMPEFEDTTSFAEPRCPPPEAPPEEWLATTRSIFPENNPPGETWGWGWIPERKRLVVPLLDEPYLPPYDIVGAEDGSKKLMMRGLWDPELFTTEGRMVPPLRERGQELYREPRIEHPDEPLWTTELAPAKSREEKIREQISIIPVKSFARFKPKKVEVELPDFLWNLAREDAAGQGLWDVIAQRHEIPREIRRQREEEAEQLRQVRQAEQEAIEETMRLEEAQAQAQTMGMGMGGVSGGSSPSRGSPSRGSPYRGSPPRTPLSPMRQQQLAEGSPSHGHGYGHFPGSEPDTGLQSQPRMVVTEQVDGMPSLEVEAPVPPTPSAQPPPPVSHEAQQLTAAAGPFPSSPQSTVRPSSRQEALQAHQQRVQELVSRGGSGQKVHELLSDDRFLDNLAEKISNRLGGPSAGFISPTATGALGQGGFGSAAMQSGMGGTRGMDGMSGTGLAGGTQILKPEPPSFAEPVDEQSRATLPPSLMGAQASADATKPKEPTPTITDVNYFTQEKMRGDCYVRLLIQPEPNAARKDPVPYVGTVMNPDLSLVADRGRPHLMVPPKAKQFDDEYDDEDEDEFADFDRNDAVVFSFVRHNRYDAVEALLGQEVETLRAKDEAGNNLLHVACQNNNRRIAKLLLKNGVSINEQNNRGNTPLHYCNHYGFSQLAEYLISHGADENIPNHQDLLPSQGIGRSEDAIAQAQRKLQADRAGGPGGL